MSFLEFVVSKEVFSLNTAFCVNVLPIQVSILWFLSSFCCVVVEMKDISTNNARLIQIHSNHCSIVIRAIPDHIPDADDIDHRVPTRSVSRVGKGESGWNTNLLVGTSLSEPWYHHHRSCVSWLRITRGILEQEFLLVCRRDRALAKQRGYRRFMITRFLDRCIIDQNATDQTELIQSTRLVSQMGFE